jgi:uncharacterized protein YajQ (UPF0234 family)
MSTMAKDNSFDVVSQVDMQEVDNAYGQVQKELLQRYDLKDSGSEIEFDKKKGEFTVVAPSDFVSGQVIDVLGTKLIRRGIDLKAISWSKPEAAHSGMVRVSGTIINGIEQDISRKINKDIKDRKYKVKVTIEGDKLRVSGPKRDDLQAVISFLKEQDYGLPLQFENYR